MAKPPTSPNPTSPTPQPTGPQLETFPNNDSIAYFYASSEFENPYTTNENVKTTADKNSYLAKQKMIVGVNPIINIQSVAKFDDPLSMYNNNKTQLVQACNLRIGSCLVKSGFAVGLGGYVPENFNSEDNNTNSPMPTFCMAHLNENKSSFGSFNTLKLSTDMSPYSESIAQPLVILGYVYNERYKPFGYTRIPISSYDKFMKNNAIINSKITANEFAPTNDNSKNCIGPFQLVKSNNKYPNHIIPYVAGKFEKSYYNSGLQTSYMFVTEEQIKSDNERKFLESIIHDVWADGTTRTIKDKDGKTILQYVEKQTNWSIKDDDKVKKTGVLIYPVMYVKNPLPIENHVSQVVPTYYDSKTAGDKDAEAYYIYIRPQDVLLDDWQKIYTTDRCVYSSAKEKKKETIKTLGATNNPGEIKLRDTDFINCEPLSHPGVDTLSLGGKFQLTKFMEDEKKEITKDLADKFAGEMSKTDKIKLILGIEGFTTIETAKKCLYSTLSVLVVVLIVMIILYIIKRYSYKFNNYTIADSNQHFYI